MPPHPFEPPVCSCGTGATLEDRESRGLRKAGVTFVDQTHRGLRNYWQCLECRAVFEPRTPEEAEYRITSVVRSYMIVNVFCPRNIGEDEVSAIKALCKLEGHTFAPPLWQEDHATMIKRFYKGGRPAIVIGRYPPDVPNDPDRIVLFGFWALVEHIQKNGLIRC